MLCRCGRRRTWTLTAFLAVFRRHGCCELNLTCIRGNFRNHAIIQSRGYKRCMRKQVSRVCRPIVALNSVSFHLRCLPRTQNTVHDFAHLACQFTVCSNNFGYSFLPVLTLQLRHYSSDPDGKNLSKFPTLYRVVLARDARETFVHSKLYFLTLCVCLTVTSWCPIESAEWIELVSARFIGRRTWHILEFCTCWNIYETAKDRGFKVYERIGHVK